MNKTVSHYDRTAGQYDDRHNLDTNPEHTRALELGWPLFAANSVLDVGCGTGRTLLWLSERNPNLTLFGIEPSGAMIDVARQKLPDADIRVGNGEALPYESNSVDVAIATGIMHHADNPSRAIDEMFRVARKGILISDHNNYAFGGSKTRRIRMALKLAGLLGAFTFVKQGFNKQGYSDDDGYWYPYSLFDNYAQIAKQAERVYIIPTRNPTSNEHILFAQSHIAIAAIKPSS